MPLSSDLIAKFVKMTNDKNDETGKEASVYGTTVKNDGVVYVQIDGSEILTPVLTTSAVKDGERVLVRIKNHTALIIGNITSPSASDKDLQRVDGELADLSANVAEFNTVITKNLEAEIARIDLVVADNVLINEELVAVAADIGDLKAENVEITGKLEASDAEIASLKTNKLDAKDASITYATIENLDAANASIYNLNVDYGNFKKLTTDDLTAKEAEIESLKTDKLDADTASITYATIKSLEATDLKVANLSAEYGDFKNLTTETLEANAASILELETTKLSAKDIEGKYANIDFSNIDKATMETFYANSGLIQDVQIGDATISGRLVGVTISGDLIEAETLVAEKLVIKGEDGLYYKLNTDGVTTTGEQTDYNSLNGKVILAKSITADKITVTDLVAFGATIGGYHIGDHKLYSGVKDSPNNTTRGTYLDDDGQFAIGDATNFLKFYKDGDKYRMAISAESFVFSSSKKSVEETINNTVKDVRIEYALSDSFAVPPTDGWSISSPDWIEGKYIWQRVTNIFVDGTETPKSVVCIQGAKGKDGENATIIRIDSSRGTVFKNNQLSTVLSAIVMHGGEKIEDINSLHRVFGDSSYLQWSWKRLDEDRFGIISVTDSRISNDGFIFTLSSDDVDTKIVFQCDLIT